MPDILCLIKIIIKYYKIDYKIGIDIPERKD